MKAYETRGRADHFRGNIIGGGAVADTGESNYAPARHGEREIDCLGTCPFSLETRCETAFAGKKQRKRLCPFTLEVVGASSMPYCTLGI